MRAGTVSFATAIIASARFKPASGRSRCAAPRVRDRGGAGEAGKIRFTSAILPPYLRRAKSIEELGDRPIFHKADISGVVVFHHRDGQTGRE